LYELGEHDGEVIVTDDTVSGVVRRGVYDTRGNWRSGDQLSVCPNMCIWVGDGPRQTPPLSTHRRFMNVKNGADQASP
jgi:hypothetical protein